MNTAFRFCCFMLLALVLLALGASAAEYKNFDDALREGTKLARDKQFAEAQTALETALTLAKDDEARLKAYQALVVPYRQLPEIDKMLVAQDFIIAHSDQRSRRSLAARDLASFLHQRGKVDTAVERYEARLQKDPRDLLALNVLAVIHKNIRDDKLKGSEFQQRLESVNLEWAEKLALKHEAAAAAATQLQAWHWKEAALAWVDANDKEKALIAAKKSASAPPEMRSDILAFYWREGLGQAFLKAGDAKSAITHLEAAATLAPSKIHRDEVEKKIAEAKGTP
ncbi:tetratricopeptide repeat protein [Anatilimnocola floriformis]|uniref:tetratricopeptide repeat protein n=1 Tax=Anatilimnocola floriformis TaxID=2948575 RepID=UPI0020C2F8CE|nr:tetratricopeptide repeat protein [Anatilimnocola floriformis]